MKFTLSGYRYSLLKQRVGIWRENELSLTFTTEGKILFLEAIQTAIESSVKESCRDKQLHLLGIVDITAVKYILQPLSLEMKNQFSLMLNHYLNIWILKLMSKNNILQGLNHIKPIGLKVHQHTLHNCTMF